MKLRLALLVTTALLLSACTKTTSKPRLELAPVTRQTAPELAYATSKWVQPEQPIPGQVSNNTPLLSPEFCLELESATLKEALHALSQSIGYGVDVPASLAGRKVSLNKVGTMEQLLDALAKQASVMARINHQTRRISVTDGRTIPQLPRASVSR